MRSLVFVVLAFLAAVLASTYLLPRSLWFLPPWLRGLLSLIALLLLIRQLFRSGVVSKALRESPLASAADFGPKSLISAARTGDGDKIIAELSKGADPDSIDDFGAHASSWTALMFAAINAPLGSVKALIDKGANVNFSDCVSSLQVGRTPLMLASARGRVDVVQLLIQAGANVNAVDSSGWTALTWAIKARRAEVAPLLLQAGADPNFYDVFGEPLIVLASELGESSIVHNLIAYGAQVDGQSLSTGATALMNAAERGDVDLVKSLIDRGASLASKDRNGYNALLWAKAEGNNDIIRLLVGHSRSNEDSNPWPSLRPLSLSPKTNARADTSDAEQKENLTAIDLLLGPDGSEPPAPPRLINSVTTESDDSALTRTLRVWAQKTAPAKWELRIRFVFLNRTSESIALDDLHVRHYEVNVPTPAYLTIGYLGEVRLTDRNTLQKDSGIDYALRPGDGFEIVLVLQFTRVEGVPNYGYRESSPTVSKWGPMQGYGPTDGPVRNTFGLIVDYYSVENGRRFAIPSDCIYVFQAVNKEMAFDTFQAIDDMALETLKSKYADDEARQNIISNLGQHFREHRKLRPQPRA